MIKNDLVSQFVTVPIGLLLLVAGARSVVHSFVIGIEFSDIATIPLNLIGGSLFVLHGNQQLVRCFGLVLFSAYSAYLGVLLTQGSATCSCLGPSTPAKWMLVADLIVVVSLGLLLYCGRNQEVAKAVPNFSNFALVTCRY